MEENEKMTCANQNSNLATKLNTDAHLPHLLRVAFSATTQTPLVRDRTLAVWRALEPLLEDDVVKRRILIADDEARVLLILHDSLKKLGDAYEITTAHNGRDALQLARAGHFDLVITDLRMPGLGGVELARRVKAARPDTQFIWITAYGCHNVAEDCARLGILACLDKPLEIGEIRRRVQEALRSLDEQAPEGNGAK
jgi:CheY-like chemotaxis protein